jgi:hypothetical protein
MIGGTIRKDISTPEYVRGARSQTTDDLRSAVTPPVAAFMQIPPDEPV